MIKPADTENHDVGMTYNRAEKEGEAVCFFFESI